MMSPAQTAAQLVSAAIADAEGCEWSPKSLQAVWAAFDALDALIPTPAIGTSLDTAYALALGVQGYCLLMIDYARLEGAEPALEKQLDECRRGLKRNAYAFESAIGMDGKIDPGEIRTARLCLLEVAS